MPVISRVRMNYINYDDRGDRKIKFICGPTDSTRLSRLCVYFLVHRRGSYITCSSSSSGEHVTVLVVGVGNTSEEHAAHLPREPTKKKAHLSQDQEATKKTAHLPRGRGKEPTTQKTAAFPRWGWQEPRRSRAPHRDRYNVNVGYVLLLLSNRRDVLLPLLFFLVPFGAPTFRPPRCDTDARGRAREGVGPCCWVVVVHYQCVNEQS